MIFTIFYNFIYIISQYCDIIISSHQYIKKLINVELLETYIISLSRKNALDFIREIKQNQITLYPTRKERYLLYKQLKGKDSPVVVYSFGKEKSNTRKCLIIKKK